MMISLNFEVNITEVDHNLLQITPSFSLSETLGLEGPGDSPMWQL